MPARDAPAATAQQQSGSSSGFLARRGAARYSIRRAWRTAAHAAILREPRQHPAGRPRGVAAHGLRLVVVTVVHATGRVDLRHLVCGRERRVVGLGVHPMVPHPVAFFLGEVRGGELLQRRPRRRRHVIVVSIGLGEEVLERAERRGVGTALAGKVLGAGAELADVVRRLALFGDAQRLTAARNARERLIGDARKQPVLDGRRHDQLGDVVDRLAGGLLRGDRAEPEAVALCRAAAAKGRGGAAEELPQVAHVAEDVGVHGRAH